MNKWNIQSEKDLWNEPIDWSSTYYSVILKDGREREICTYADECADGTINTYCEYTDDDSGVDFDDILLWKPIEKPDYEGMVKKFKAAVDGKTDEELSELFEDEVQIPTTVDGKKKKEKNPRTQFEIKSLYGRRLSDEYQWCVNNLPLKEDRGLSYWVTEIYIITSSQAIIDKLNKHFGSSFDFKNSWNSRTFFLN